MNKKVKRAISIAIGAAYTPLYFAGFLLNRVARLALMVSYILLLDGRKARDIIKGIFTIYY